MKRLILYLPFVLLTFGCRNGNDEPDAYGSFEATEVTVSSLANGRLMALAVEEGQLLDSGQMVGFIDTTDLHLKKLQGMEQKNATGSRKDDILAQIAVQEQSRDNILIEKDRVEKLLRDGAATRKQLDDINSQLKLIDRQIGALKTQFGGIDDQVGSTEQQIAQLRESISNARILNPVKGTVLTKFAETGEVTTFGKPLYRIADLRVMELRVYVSGAQLPHIKIGDRVEVRIDKDEKTNTKAEGTVSWISQTAEFTPKTIQTKEERVNLVYAVKVRVANDGSLKIGMPGEIKFISH
ncbi:MAG TPA: HlyD family efflux transporter periplasmic adaptor subunit [Bacteroidales bacterium]|nr:HlyD family efflux transporter periplasmic adaptor subunit [Bacteroidales bacterium]HPS63023.1 HlyD family efflux transporter periplasmic adaptor subunit [Bacteroidales bacterium]